MPYWENNSNGAVTPQGVDPSYSAMLEQARIQRQRQLAQQNIDTQMPDGKMVSGWYVAPSAGGYLASGLKNVVGAMGMKQADQAERENVAQSQANVTALAQALQNMKGKQTGVDENGNPVFAAPTFNDKLPVYQQLQQAGPFGQFVAQHGIERDLAGPSYQKVGEGEKLYQFGKDGSLNGVLEGGVKKHEFDRKIETIAAAHPELSRQAVVDIAHGNVILDTQSGKLINKATGQAPDYGQTQPTAFPLATAQQQGGVPARGQTFTGPQSSALPLATGQAPVNPIEADRQRKHSQEMAPKLKTAQDGLASIKQLEDAYTELEGLLSKNGKGAPPITTGHLRGLIAEKTGNVFDNAQQDRLESLIKGLSLSTIQAMPGMTQVFNSNEEGKRLSATLPNRSYDNSANLQNIRSARALLAEKKANLQAELQGLGGVNTSAPAAPAGNAGFTW